MLLSVIIPVYNERYVVGELVRRVLAEPPPDGLGRELVVIDDGSTDGTAGVLQRLEREHPGVVRLLRHERRHGKGAALRTGVTAARGELCLFQDADLEYDPRDHGRLLGPLLEGRADAVFGSRFETAGRRRVLLFWHTVGNRLVTLACNAVANINLTDAGTGAKAFRVGLLRTLPIRSESFGVEAELAIKSGRRGWRIYEVPVSYDGRTYAEGKKATWRAGVAMLAVAVKSLFVDDLFDTGQSGHATLADLSRARHFNAWMADVIRPHLGDRVLEVGAGIGNLATQFLPRDRYVAGELDELHLGVLRNTALRRADLEIVPLDATRSEDFESLRGGVDTVVCLNVLEHIPDESAALANMRGVLPPGGRLVVLVPQGPGLFSPLDEALEHQRRYDRASLTAALERAGLEVERLIDFNRPGVLGWWLNGRVLRRRRLGGYQLRIYDALVWLWRRTEWLWPWHGLSLIAVARRPEGGEGAGR